MKIEAGKRYVRRDGKISGVIEKGCTDDLYPFCDDDSGDCYREDGLWLLGEESDEDLISEYVEPIAEQPAETETLRDRFAMAALAGSINVWPCSSKLEDCCLIAYRVADAMLKARQK